MDLDNTIQIRASYRPQEWPALSRVVTSPMPYDTPNDEILAPQQCQTGPIRRRGRLHAMLKQART